MNTDDLIYIAILVASVPVGYAIKCLKTPTAKQIATTAIGLVILLFVCQTHVWHSILTIAINSIIIKLCGPSRCHIVSFVWCFGYIVFFRTTQYFGVAVPTPHANAVQLLLTLKLVGLAFEIHNNTTLKKNVQKDDTEESRLELEYRLINPTLYDTICYSYCYVGLLTGPYYKYRTYHDMLHNSLSAHLHIGKHLANKLVYAVGTASCYLVANHYFSIKYVTTDEFYEQPFWYRLVYFVPMFFVFRTRLYFAWLMSEAICVTSMMGCYPADSKPSVGKGPTDLKKLKQSYEAPHEEQIALDYSYECIRNVDIYDTETSPTVRDGLRSWNKCVQYWLAVNVYKNIPWKIPVVRMSITMGVSAFWHGVHPGYYLSLLTVPFVVAAEDCVHKAFLSGLSGSKLLAFKWVNWFLKMRIFDYMCMAFMLLTLEDTIKYWRSIYFIGHVATLGFFVLGVVYAPKRKPDYNVTDKKEN